MADEGRGSVVIHHDPGEFPVLCEESGDGGAGEAPCLPARFCHASFEAWGGYSRGVQNAGAFQAEGDPDLYPLGPGGREGGARGNPPQGEGQREEVVPGMGVAS